MFPIKSRRYIREMRKWKDKGRKSVKKGRKRGKNRRCWSGIKYRFRGRKAR